MRKKIGTSKSVKKALIWATVFMMSFTSMAGNLGCLQVHASEGEDGTSESDHDGGSDDKSETKDSDSKDSSDSGKSGSSESSAPDSVKSNDNYKSSTESSNNASEHIAKAESKVAEANRESKTTESSVESSLSSSNSSVSNSKAAEKESEDAIEKVSESVDAAKAAKEACDAANRSEEAKEYAEKASEAAKEAQDNAKVAEDKAKEAKQEYEAALKAYNEAKAKAEARDALNDTAASEAASELEAAKEDLKVAKEKSDALTVEMNAAKDKADQALATAEKAAGVAQDAEEDAQAKADKAAKDAAIIAAENEYKNATDENRAEKTISVLQAMYPGKQISYDDSLKMYVLTEGEDETATTSYVKVGTTESGYLSATPVTKDTKDSALNINDPSDAETLTTSIESFDVKDSVSYDIDYVVTGVCKTKSDMHAPQTLLAEYESAIISDVDAFNKSKFTIGIRASLLNETDRLGYNNIPIDKINQAKKYEIKLLVTAEVKNGKVVYTYTDTNLYGQTHKLEVPNIGVEYFSYSGSWAQVAGSDVKGNLSGIIDNKVASKYNNSYTVNAKGSYDEYSDGVSDLRGIALVEKKAADEAAAYAKNLENEVKGLEEAVKSAEDNVKKLEDSKVSADELKKAKDILDILEKNLKELEEKAKEAKEDAKEAERIAKETQDRVDQLIRQENASSKKDNSGDRTEKKDNTTVVTNSFESVMEEPSTEDAETAGNTIAEEVSIAIEDALTPSTAGGSNNESVSASKVTVKGTAKNLNLFDIDEDGTPLADGGLRINDELVPLSAQTGDDTLPVLPIAASGLAAMAMAMFAGKKKEN